MIFLLLILQKGFSEEVPYDMNKMGDKTIYMNAGDIYLIKFNDKNGIFVPRDVHNCYVSYQVEKMNERKNGTLDDNLLFIFFGDSLGLINITATQNTVISFSWATYPSNCEKIYFENIENNHVELLPNSVSCYYNSFPLPMHILIDINISMLNYLELYNNDGKISTLNKNDNEDSIIYILKDPTVFLYKGIGANNAYIQAKSNNTNYETINMFSNFLNLSNHNDGIIVVYSPITNNENKKLNTVTLLWIAGISFILIAIIIEIIFVFYCKRRCFAYRGDLKDINSKELEIMKIESDDEDSTQSTTKKSDIPAFKDHFYRDDAEGYPEIGYMPAKEGYSIPSADALKSTENDPNRLP